MVPQIGIRCRVPTLDEYFLASLTTSRTSIIGFGRNQKSIPQAERTTSLRARQGEVRVIHTFQLLWNEQPAVKSVWMHGRSSGCSQRGLNSKPR